MKKIIALVLALVMVAACMTACGAKGATLKDVQKAGKLMIATSPDFPPFESLEGDAVVGIEPDIMKLIGEKLGVEIEFVVIDWNNKIFELDGKGIDVVWNGMTLTDAVMEAMECSNAYCNNAQVVITK